VSRPPAAASVRPDAPLPLGLKLGFAVGDHTVSISLAAVSLYYLFFLTEVAGLRPALASLVVLSGRAVDAFTDPAMGRISDVTRSRFGRRRPYFLIGALPFGLSFAFLWQQLDADGQAGRFALYAAVYILHTLSSTILAVPYMALLPELARGYVQRTEINVYRYGADLPAMAEAEIQPQGASFVLASEAALINIIFGLVHLFRPGAGYWRSAAVCRGRPIMPWPRTSAA